MGRKKYIDQIDINLLNALSANPQLNIAQLGEEIDLTPGPTHTRLERLRKDGFIRSDYKINYSKFGLEEKVFMFELKIGTTYYGDINQDDVLADVTKRLSQVKHALIESVEQYNDEDNKLWVMIRFYPITSETHIFGDTFRSKVYLYEPDIERLITGYISYGLYYHLNRREKTIPQLTVKHRMKNEPPQ